MTVRPVADWIPAQTYDIEVRGITESSGNETPPVAWSFRIAADGASDSTALRVVSSTPAQNAVGVPTDTPIGFEFSKLILPADNPNLPNIFFSCSGNGLQFSPLLQSSRKHRRHAGSPFGHTGPLRECSGSVSFAYSTGSIDDVSDLRVLSIKPADNSNQVPVDATIELRFNQAVNQSALVASLLVWNDGALAPMAASSDADGKIWLISPLAPWRENSTVAVQISTTAFSASGALLLNPFSAKFFVVRSAANNSPSNGLAAIEVSTAVIDLRFAEPRDNPPGEPFGLRLGQQRVPARVEHLGAAWFRLTPDSPLDPALPCYLMAGPGVEIPMRFTNDAEPITIEGRDSMLAGRQEENGLFNRETEVRRRIARKDLRQQGNGIRRYGQTSPARDQCLVVG